MPIEVVELVADAAMAETDAFGFKTDQDEQLRSILRQSPQVRNLLLSRVKHVKAWEIKNVLLALKDLAQTDSAVRDTALSWLRDSQSVKDREWVESAAISVLAPLSGVDLEVRAEIQDRCNAPDSMVRGSAIGALQCAAESDHAVRAFLMKKLNSEDDGRCIAALGSLVEKDAEVRESILRIALLEGNGWRSSAINSLAPLVNTDARVRTAVINAAHDPQYYLRVRALSALADQVSSNADARAAAETRLKDPEPYVRRAAITALQGLAGRDTEVTKNLCSLLSHQHEQTREEAIRA